MPRKTDPLQRSLTLLKLIPRHPGMIATTTLQEKLKDRGFEVTLRTLQRDMNTLSAQFPITCNESERPHRWYFDRDYNHSLPGMDTNEALTLVLAEQYLHSLLPAAVLDNLAGPLNEARKHLDSIQANGHGSWQSKVRLLPAHQSLVPARFNSDVWHVVTDALLHHHAIEARYRKRHNEEPSSYLLHPQGIVHRHSVTYLLATVKDYDDVLQFALHRFESAQATVTPYRPLANFSVDSYISNGGFGLLQSQETVTLKALISRELFVRLQETPLNEAQVLTSPDDSGWGQLTAQVRDEQTLFWWLQSMGGAIRVLAPKQWRDELLRQAKELVGWYEGERLDLIR